MPEFQRSWRDWAEENFPEATHYAPDKTAKSPSVSFVRPIVPASSQNIAGESPSPLPACLVPACRFAGYAVDLGAGLTTRLCAAHRRELYACARDMAGADGA